MFTRKGYFSQEEFEADVFAMCLLMPRKEVLRIWNEYKTIKCISDYFNVPLDVAAFRLNMLNLID